MARPAQPMQVFPKGRPAETLEGRQRHQWAESSLSTGKGTALHRMRGPEAARVTSGTARLSRHVSKLARRSLPVHRDKHPDLSPCGSSQHVQHATKISKKQRSKNKAVQRKAAGRQSRPQRSPHTRVAPHSG